VQRTGINRNVKIRIWRAGQEQELEVVIEELGASQSQQSSSNQLVNPKNYEEILQRLGMQVRSFNSIERMRGFQGALVSAINPSGIAAELFDVYDIIVAVNQKEVTSAEDFYQWIAQSVTAGATEVTLLRDSQARNVTIPAIGSK
jgi:PDZ domain-containing secreted protein